MSALSPDAWQEISPYLDHALSLSEQERAEWLSEFRAQRSDIANLVQELLQEHEALSQEHFLEHQPQPPNEDTLLGETVGPYKLISRIGEGGMGNVWLAERADGRFERQVAVKFVHFSITSRGAVERFKREGKILGQLRHPHIAELIDAGLTPKGEPYLVLEYVQGQHIDDYCDMHKLGVDARIKLFLDVLGAVAHAHSNLVVHRDIKPSNVLVRSDSDLKLLDFGIAKLLAEDTNAGAATLLTLEGGGAMTPLFAAPEQVTGGSITTATDVYALGALLFLLLTGRHPAGSSPHSPAALIKSIIEIDAPLMSQTVAVAKDATSSEKRSATPEKLSRQLRGDLDTMVAKALNKNPVERYASVAAFDEDLRRYLRHEPITARRDAVSYRLRKYVRRHRVGVAFSAGLISLLVGFSVIQAIQLRRITRERNRADRIADFMTGIFKVSDPNEHAGQAVTAREVLDKAASDIRGNLSNEPELRSQMLHVMGRAYLNLGIYSRAESLFREGVQVSQSIGRQNSRDTLNMTHDLAWALLQQGRVAQAESIERKLLEMQRRVLGPEDGDTAATMEELAYTICTEGKGQCAEAIELTRHVLAQHQRELGPDAFYTLVTMNNLATMLARNGQLKEAIDVQEESLKKCLGKFGRENIDTVNAMLGLGEFQRDAGREDDAQATLEKLLAIENRAFAPDQGETAATKYDLASVLIHKSQTDRALALLREALDGGLSPLIAQGLATDPLFTSLHNDHRFKRLVALVQKRFPRQSPQKPN